MMLQCIQMSPSVEGGSWENAHCGPQGSFNEAKVQNAGDNTSSNSSVFLPVHKSECSRETRWENRKEP